MSNIKEITDFKRELIPVNAKIIKDIKKDLGIKAPEALEIILLTDATSTDLEDIRLKNGRIYIIMSKKDRYHNDFVTLKKDLNSIKLQIEWVAYTDIGQIQSIRTSFEQKITETKNTEETSSKESERLKDFFDEILDNGLTTKASDIHIEKRKNHAQIRMRRHGELEVAYIDQDVVEIEKLCRTIYNILAENEGKDVSYSSTDYQQAAVNTKIKNEEIKLRYQSLPTYPEGFDVVLRILPIGKDDEKIIPLVDLGFSPSQEEQINEIISKPVGALIISGTTGSGKSTTLKNLLMSVNLMREYKCKIYTIEDPPEYKIPNVSQIPVTRRRNDTSGVSPFHAPLVATMRGDPDLLMIGEIRDELTGDGLKKATQSGHQVMTTVHAASALGIVERLSDFTITPSVMGSPEFITGLIYQKLLPVVCADCALPFSTLLESAASDTKIIELSRRIDSITENIDPKDINIKIRNHQGCPKCRHTGISGRTICAEVISPDFEMLSCFKTQNSVGAMKHWLQLSDDNPISSNMTGKSAQEHALYKMFKGLISPFDLEVAFGKVDHSKNLRVQLSNTRTNREDFMNEFFGVGREVQNAIASKARHNTEGKEEEKTNINAGLKWEN